MDEIIDIDDLFEDAEVDPPAPEEPEAPMPVQAITDQAVEYAPEEPVDMPVATEEAPPVMVADIDDLFTEEEIEEERIFEAQDRRDIQQAGTEGLIYDKSVARFEDDVPALAEYDKEAQRTISELSWRGMPGALSKEDAMDINPHLPIEWVQTLPTNKQIEEAASLAAGPEEQTFYPPGGETVRDPTVLSTVFDVLETPQRAFLSPLFAAYSEDGESGFLEKWGDELSKAFSLPSHQRGQTAHDAMWLYKQISEDLGFKPGGWGNTVGSIAFSIATDPLSYLGVGAAKKAASSIASRQVGNLAKEALDAGSAVPTEHLYRLVSKNLRKANVTGDLNAEQTSSAIRQITKEIIESGPLEKQTLEAAKPKIRKFLETNLGADTAKEFDEIAPFLGKEGVVAGLPFMAKKEIVTAQSLSKALAPAKLLISKAGEKPAKAINSVLSLVNPRVAIGLNKSINGNLDFYQQSRHIEIAAEAAKREAEDVIGEFAEVGVAKAEEGQRLLALDPEKALKEATKGEGVSNQARTWATISLNTPYRQATQRISAVSDGGIVPNDLIAGLPDDSLRILEKAYAEGVIGLAGGVDKQDIINGMRKRFVVDGESTLNGLDVDDVFSVLAKASGSLTKDADVYTKLQKATGEKVAGILSFHKSMVDEFLEVENKYIANAAKRAGNERVQELMARGVKDANALKKGRKSAEDKVLAKQTEEVQNYFYHFVQNLDEVRVKQLFEEVRPGSAKAHRRILDVGKKVELGLNPADDILVSLAARTYAHIKTTANRKLDELLFRDPHHRWSVPTKGKRKSDFSPAEWSVLSHPVTGKEYFVRKDVHEAYKRMREFNAPGRIEKMLGYYDSLLGRWKGYATHGRPLFYNLRNMVDDGFRMFMGGFGFDTKIMGEAYSVGQIGKLKTKVKTKPFRLRVKGPDRSRWHAFVKRNADDIEASYESELKTLSDKRIHKHKDKEATASLGELYDAASELGVIDKGYVSADLAGDLPKFLDKGKVFDKSEMAAKTINPMSKKHALLGPQGYYLTGTGNIARSAENLRRLALFVDGWKRGMTFAESAQNVRKWLFDYSELTDVERKLFRRVMPFYTFMRKNIPSQIEAMTKKPGSYLAVKKGKQGIEDKAEQDYGPVGVVRDYMDDLGAIRLPVKSKRNSPVFWSPGLSMTDLNTAGVLFPNMKMGQDELWDRFTPVISLSDIVVKKKDPRTGLSMRGKYMEADPWVTWIAKQAGVPVKKRTNYATGETYEVVPSWMVRASRKMFPHFIAFGRAFGVSDRIDPFESEQAGYRMAKELTGQSLLVNNPIKAEIQLLRQAKKLGLAEAAAMREDEIDKITE